MALGLLICLAAATYSMPSIARYLSQTGAPSSLPTAEASPAAYGSGLARSMQQVGADRMQEEARLAAQVDETAAKAADVEFNSEIRKLLYDPEAGYLNKQNKDAVDGFGDTMSQVDTLRQKYAAGLTGRQRLLFDNSAQVRVDAVYQTGASHARTQGQNYQNTVALARANDLASDAAAFAGDEQRTSVLYDTALGEWLGVAERQGLQGEAMQSYVKEKASEWHIGLTNALIAKDPIAAQGYLAKHRSGIDGRELWQLEDKIGKALQPYYLQQDQANLDARLYAATEPGARPGSGKLSQSAAQNARSIAKDAQAAGVDPVLAAAVQGVESSHGTDPRAKNELQYLDRPDASRADALKELGRRREIAASAVGGQPENWQTYVVWQQGEGGGPALLRADQNAKAVDILAPLYGNRATAESAVTGNGGTVDMTVGDFLGVIKGYYEKRENQTRSLLAQDEGKQRGREAQLVKGEVVADVMPAQAEADAAVPPPAGDIAPPRMLTLGEKLAQVRGMGLPPEREQALLTQVKASHAIEEADRADRQRNASNTAYARMTEDPSFNPINLSPEEKQAIGIQGMQALNAAYETGMDIKTDYAVYYDLKQMAAQSKEKFQKLNLMEFAHKLAPTELKSLLDLQADERKMVDVTDITQMIDDALISIDITPSPSDKTGEEAKIGVGVRRFIDQQLQVFTQREGREPTRKEQQEIVDRAIMTVKPDTSWFGDDSKRGYQLKLEDLTIDMVPESVKAEIISDMQQYGLDTTDETVILKLWFGAGMPGLKPVQ